MQKRIIITGASGFIGSALVETLLHRDYEVIALSRNPGKHAGQFSDGQLKLIEWDAETGKGWSEWAEGAKAIVNLAGENLASGIWTASKKKKLLESRIKAGHAVTDALKRVSRRPEVLIQSSAIGLYGSRGEEIITEESEKGAGFLAELTRAWEESVKEADSLGVRVVILRIGMVLDKDGGALAKLKLPFYFYVGGHLGTGEQWVSWIYRRELVRIILYAIENSEVKGVFNATSPEPVKFRTLSEEIGKAMSRPSWFHVPGFLLKLIFGKMARETLLTSQRILPQQLIASGYEFDFPDVQETLEDIF